MDESVPQTNGDDLPPIVSQTQTEINDSHEGSDDEESPIPLTGDVPQFDTITRQLNNVFDDNDDYLSANFKEIIDHRSSNSILELKVEYTDGEVEWHPLNLIEDEDPHAAANYIIDNDTGPISNIIHGR